MSEADLFQMLVALPNLAELKKEVLRQQLDEHLFRCFAQMETMNLRADGSATTFVQQGRTAYLKLLANRAGHFRDRANQFHQAANIEFRAGRRLEVFGESGE